MIFFFFFFFQLYGFVGTFRSSCLTLCAVVTMEIHPASPSTLSFFELCHPVRGANILDVFFFFSAVLFLAPLQCAHFSHPQSSKCAVCRAVTKFNIPSQIKALCGYIYPLLQDERKGGGFWASLENALWLAALSAPGSCLPAGGNALIDVTGLINGGKLAVSEVSVQCAILKAQSRNLPAQG